MKMKLIPCKHLDYEADKYGPDIKLREVGPSHPGVRYWERGKRWTDNGPDDPPNPACVQFCGQGRGRINAIFDCYDGSMHCYEPERGDA